MASRDSGLGLRTGLSQTPPGAVVASAGVTGEGSHYKLAAFASRMWLLQDWWPEADIKSSPAGICSDTPSKTTGFIRGGCRRHIPSVAFRHCCRSLLMRSEALGSTHTWGMGSPGREDQEVAVTVTRAVNDSGTRTRRGQGRSPGGMRVSEPAGRHDGPALRALAAKPPAMTGTETGARAGNV